MVNQIIHPFMFEVFYVTEMTGCPISLETILEHHISSQTSPSINLKIMFGLRLVE